MSNIPEKILSAFPIGEVNQIEPVRIGLIHHTYKIFTPEGGFVLQKLHPVLATPEIAEDFFAVTEFLHAQNMLAPRCVRTREGEVLAQDEEGNKWRLQTCLEGESVETISSQKEAEEAGRMFGRFHQIMSDFPHTFKTQRALHDTPQIYQTFTDVVSGADPELLAPIKDLCETVSQNMPDLLLPKSLPERVIHGDPKISNILFNKDKEAVAIIDLDTCNRRSVLVELGDAFRSWCGQKEDDPQNTFSLEVFTAAWGAYKKEVGDWLSPEEELHVLGAIKLITLELTARFLTDYVQDSYFGWNAERYGSRREHNLARAKGQVALYDSINEQEPAIKQVMKKS